MVKRRDLKEKHEEAVLLGFKAFFEKNGNHFEIISKPEPPDAIVKIDERERWIEITDAFLDKEHAIGVTSRASEDVVHKRDDRRLIIEPNAKFRAQLIKVVLKKYDKATMQNLNNDLGGGILLVGIFTPFCNAEDIFQTECETLKKLIVSKPCKVFDEIYVYDNRYSEFYLIYREQA